MDHRFFRRWLWPSTPKKASQTFRVHTKLNSEEALRRFLKIRDSLQMTKQEIVDICRMLEEDGQLQAALFKADTELLVTILAVRTYKVGEREYIGTAVLALEDLMSRTRTLFLKAHPAVRSYRGSTPSELHFLARTLAQEIHQSIKCLASMREQVRNEVYPDDAASVEVQTNWRAWICQLYGGGSNSGRGMKAESGNSVQRAKEHHEREHLFTRNGWEHNGGRCRCLDYQ
ncbi:uncharacterized protein A1O5_05809 [Cladophialophora psammophila CBS 110553]|uniref:Uncharacterized protein n=1 Tax=Cladophialophora psammophila CBS 110553 TaxID=1182543 RepID=W9XKC9_9EURO|nr:uncharacterized protein A1O5_05809 [Cladophialophora psammophila CBS 110553]EXJ70819.1 hypothetical protein A1O5_05809 [Cladophialophora psammophila CBS 110553]